MIRLLFSVIIVACSILSLFGCGEEKPMVEGEYDVTVEIDPEAEATAQKQAEKENR